jgi:hypothetical protein
MSPGPGGSHGKQHEYILTARNTSHPIVQGLPLRWLHAQDELYDRMRGPAIFRTYCIPRIRIQLPVGREEKSLLSLQLITAKHVFSTPCLVMRRNT